MRGITPSTLDELFPVFDRLERNESVALIPRSDFLQPSAAAIQSRLASDGPWLGLTSSGSTGQPKMAWKKWAELKADLSPGAAFRGWTWASPFYPWTYAGVQVALQAWASHGHTVTLTSDWDTAWRELADRKIPALSCTPTYLDLLLFMEGANRHETSLQQITLGGELLRPASGLRFLERFPPARFTVIYAQAELGLLCKTHRLDGWYELDSLTTGHPDWKLDETEPGTNQTALPQRGVLSVRARRPIDPPHSSSTWISTGDLVEIDGPQLRVLGRADAVANVAGTKVNLDEVARAAEAVPGVRMACATAFPNPITGEVVSIWITPEGGLPEDELEARVAGHLRSVLRKEAWPRHWEFGPVQLGPNNKGRLA